MKNNRGLVTGSHRSGSTWVGRVLERNSKVDIITEPYNLNTIKKFNRISYDYWYPMIHDESTAGHKELSDLMQYYLRTNSFTFLQQLFESYEGLDLYNSMKKRLRRTLRPFKLVKDPMAIFSTPWLETTFNLRPLVLIRHPAAFALSIKEKDWWFDFDNLLNQEVFFQGPLNHLKDEVLEFKKHDQDRTIIENAALFWKVCYTQVRYYQEQHPSWHYISHEALSLEPLIEFERVFQYFNLEFTSEVEAYIIQSSQADKPEFLKRNSLQNMLKWQNNLSKFEKEIIYRVTREVADSYYDPF